MKRLTAILLLAGLILFCHASSASAHVFITSESGNSGVFMHISPDDDPIAGEQTNFFFDIDDRSLGTNTNTYQLQITDGQGVTSPAAIAPTSESSLSAGYVFPVQGVYTLTIQATTVSGRGTPVNFTYTQRVSRGVTASVQAQQGHAAAEFSMVLAVSGMLILLIVIVVRHKQIASYTKQM